MEKTADTVKIYMYDIKVWNTQIEIINEKLYKNSWKLEEMTCYKEHFFVCPLFTVMPFCFMPGTITI